MWARNAMGTEESTAEDLRAKLFSPQARLARALRDAVLDNDLNKVTETLAAGARPEHQVEEFALVSTATSKCSLGVSQALFEAGAHLIRYNRNTYATPFHELYEFSPEIQGLMLESTPDVNVRDHFGRTALMTALTPSGRPVLARDPRARLAAAQRLIDAGADLNAVDDLGHTALMCAELAPDWVEFLVMRGADVNRQDRRGETALHHCFGDHTDWEVTQRIKTAELLLRADANTSLRNTAGQTAIVLAENQGFFDLAEEMRALAMAQRASNAVASIQSPGKDSRTDFPRPL